jgi:hypothetical protein
MFDVSQPQSGWGGSDGFVVINWGWDGCGRGGSKSWGSIAGL